jgi:hypothetical protein
LLFNRFSQPIPVEQPILSTTDELQEALIIEPDVDPEEENTTDREEMNWLTKSSQLSNTQHNEHIGPKGKKILLSFLIL